MSAAQVSKPVNAMTKTELEREYKRNSEQQSALTTALINLGYGRVLSFELHTLTDVPEAIEKDLLMRRAGIIRMELDSIRDGYRGAGVAA